MNAADASNTNPRLSRSSYFRTRISSWLLPLIRAHSFYIACWFSSTVCAGAVQAQSEISLLCRGTKEVSSYNGVSYQESVEHKSFEGVYNIDLINSTVNGSPASVSDKRIQWGKNGPGDADRPSSIYTINRYSGAFEGLNLGPASPSGATIDTKITASCAAAQKQF